MAIWVEKCLNSGFLCGINGSQQPIFPEENAFAVCSGIGLGMLLLFQVQALLENELCRSDFQIYALILLRLTSGTAKAQHLGCMDRNLKRAEPPLPINKIGVDLMLCWLIYLDCTFLRRGTFLYSQYCTLMLTF